MPGGTFMCIYIPFTLLSLDSGKQVNWKTVKTQMKCCLRRHFIRICTFSKIKTIFRDRNT